MRVCVQTCGCLQELQKAIKFPRALVIRTELFFFFFFGRAVGNLNH